MKTRATLTSDPFQTAADNCWRAVAVVAGATVYLTLGDDPKDLKRKDTITVERHESEWRAV